MKKKRIALLVMGVILLSCSTAPKDYANAATELCKCMNESGYDGSDAANIKMNIGVCLLDATLDLKDPQFSVEIEKKCPEMKEGFDEFVKDM